jgi:hypothetical protein
VTTQLNASFRMQFWGGEGLIVGFARSRDRRDHALLVTPCPESLLAFEPIWARLAERFHLVAIDLPGFGRSSAPTRCCARRRWASSSSAPPTPSDSGTRMSSPRCLHRGRAVHCGPGTPGRLRGLVIGSAAPRSRSSSAACAEIGGCRRSTPSPLTSGWPAALAVSRRTGPGSSSAPSGPTPSEECSEP